MRTPSATRRILFVTGTDTGVGKTVLAAALTRHLKERGQSVHAVKPLCSGGRADARSLRAALGGRVSLERINPWAFAAPVTPRVAAAQEGRRVRLAEVLGFLRAAAPPGGVLVVEGAGGLLSPLGEDFDSRDLIRALGAEVLVVAPNRLGALNHVFLTWEALPPSARRRATLVLMGAPRPSLVTRSNEVLLRQSLGDDRVVGMPFLRGTSSAAGRGGPLPKAWGLGLDRWVG